MEPVCRRPSVTKSRACARAYRPETTSKSVILGQRDNADGHCSFAETAEGPEFTSLAPYSSASLRSLFCNVQNFSAGAGRDRFGSGGDWFVPGGRVRATAAKKVMTRVWLAPSAGGGDLLQRRPKSPAGACPVSEDRCPPLLPVHARFLSWADGSGRKRLSCELKRPAQLTILHGSIGNFVCGAGLTIMR